MIPEGDLLRSRVVTDLAPALEDVLDRRLDGYAVLAPRDALLGADGTDADRGVLTFESGVPTLAYHAGTDRGGPAALADIGPGPYRLELYALDATHLGVAHETEGLRVPPGMAAERLAGDGALADRVRKATDEDDAEADGALDAFLDNEAAIEDIRESARSEAAARAEDWGFEDAIEE
ncbi:hypothetical protein HWV23_10250 [Natronomonas halophila]|uniref:hypothetical protein n=1 Tax=Natronomonas halophila TaxID=2747817 RepID=UPI0015B674D3|nr:hypothetical protein [Natronomonas halophila]QLD86092.1 hypothetical protein HWV23_10250 [Natronomonas halophila]